MAEQFGITVTPDGAGSAQIQAAGTKVAVARRPWDAFRGATQAVAQVVTADKSVEESLAGQNRAAERLAEISTMSATDRAATLAQDRADIESGESEYSEVHNKAYLAATTSTFFSATAKAKAESNMRNAATNVDSMVIPEMLPQGYDKIGAFDWIAENNDVDVATVRDMYLTKQTEYFAAQIQLQSDQIGIDEVKAQVAKTKETLMGPQFYGSRSADWKAAIKSSEAKLKAAETAMAKKFKFEAKSSLATKIGDVSNSLTSYQLPYTEVKKDMELAYGNDPMVFKTKSDEYKKKHLEATASRQFQTEYEVGELHPKLPDGSQLKTEWQSKVTNGVQAAFIEKRYEDLIDIGINEPEFVKDAGYNLMANFKNIDNPVVLNQFVNTIQATSMQTNGATALRQILGDDNYVDIIATKYMAESGLAGDMPSARAAVQQGKQNITRVDMDKKDTMDMQEYARELGSQGQKYVSVMQKLHQIDPSLAHKELKNVAEFFSNQIEEVDDRKIDKSMTPYVDNVSLDPERTQVNILKAIDAKSDSKVSNITLIGGTAMGIDPMTGTPSLVDVNAIAESVNAEIKLEKQLEQFEEEDAEGTITGDIARAWDTHTQSLVGEVPSAFVAFGSSAKEAVGNIVGRFGGYLGKSWNEDVQAMKDGINEIFPDTFGPEQEEIRFEAANDMLDEFDTLIGVTPTEDPRKYVSNNTLSAYVNEQLTATLENNKNKLKVAETLREEMVDHLRETQPEFWFNSKRGIEDFGKELDKINTANATATNNRGLP